MSSHTLDIKFEPNDAKFIQLKHAFLEELKNNFQIEDYEPIIKYVFTYIFEEKRTKEETVREMKELFAEQSDEIISWLWNYVERRILQKSPNRDLVDEITERERSFRKYDRKNKNFNSAIENIRDKRKKKFENKFDKFEDDEEGFRIKKIGDKRIILKNKDRRERSRDKDNQINGRDNRDNRFRERSFRGRGNFGNKFLRGGRFPYKPHFISKNNLSSNFQKKERKIVEEKDKNITNDQQEQTGNTDKTIEKISEEEKKKRCKNWPNCKNEKCEYHHPKETCQFFPKCQFGNSCLNIHPNIPCKYGFYCTRINCSYSHSSGYNPPMYQSFLPQATPFPYQKYKNLKLDNTKKDITTSQVETLQTNKNIINSEELHKSDTIN